MVVMHLKDNLTLGEFLMAIRHRRVALSLYIKVRVLKIEDQLHDCTARWSKWFLYLGRVQF